MPFAPRQQRQQPRSPAIRLDLVTQGRFGLPNASQKWFFREALKGMNFSETDAPFKYDVAIKGGKAKLISVSVQANQPEDVLIGLAELKANPDEVQPVPFKFPDGTDSSWFFKHADEGSSASASASSSALAPVPARPSAPQDVVSFGTKNGITIVFGAGSRVKAQTPLTRDAKDAIAEHLVETPGMTRDQAAGIIQDEFREEGKRFAKVFWYVNGRNVKKLPAEVEFMMMADGGFILMKRGSTSDEQRQELIRAYAMESLQYAEQRQEFEAAIADGRGLKAVQGGDNKWTISAVSAGGAKATVEEVQPLDSSAEARPVVTTPPDVENSTVFPTLCA